MLKVILPLAALLAFTACSSDDEDTAGDEATEEEEEEALSVYNVLNGACLNFGAGVFL